MNGYSFTITNIEWTIPSSNLPESGVVYFSTNVVNVWDIGNEDWKRLINAQLAEQYGQPAINFCFEPIGLGKFDEFVEGVSDVIALGRFHSPADNTLVFVADANDDGMLALMLMEDAIDEADDCDGYFLTADARGLYILTVDNHDGLENLARALSDKWMMHTDETRDDFGEHEQPRERHVRTRGDEFVISKIDWVSPNVNLPTETRVLLPDGLVCAERHAPGSEWNRQINDQLQAKFGIRARSFEFGRAS